MQPVLQSLAVSMCLLSGATLLWSGDFWTTRKYTEWEPKEVQKLLRESPWSKSVEFRMDGGGGGTGGGGGRGGRRGGGGGGGMSAADQGNGSDPIPAMGGGGGGAPDGATPTTTGYIRWHSALPIRQAIARMRFGQEVGTSSEAAKMLERPLDAHVVGIAGLPMNILRASGDGQPAKVQVLLNIKGKEPVAAAKVESGREQNSAVIYAFFPKQPNGADVIALEDEEVEVVFKSGRLAVKRKFKLKDMVFDGKLAI